MRKWIQASSGHALARGRACTGQATNGSIASMDWGDCEVQEEKFREAQKQRRTTHAWRNGIQLLQMFGNDKDRAGQTRAARCLSRD
eukprot:858779-Alexandrium_andersonii.AAC.1